MKITESNRHFIYIFIYEQNKHFSCIQLVSAILTCDSIVLIYFLVKISENLIKSRTIERK
jgi:hypothetical protein